MAIDYYVEFITVPLAVLVLAYQGPPCSELSASAWLTGYLSWVMIEYWMHRWLFHKRFRRLHWRHHLRPFDPTGAPGTWRTQALLAASAAALQGLLGGPLGAALGGGLLLGYVSYIATHHAVHAGWLSPESGVRKRHELHHRGVEKNFNLLNPLGDLLFGTYVKPGRR